MIISEKTIKHPLQFVIISGLILYFIQRYREFFYSDNGEEIFFAFDIGKLAIKVKYARLLAAILGVLYMLIVYKTAERIFGIKEGLYSAVMAGCNCGAFIIFHELCVTSFLITFITGFLAILIVLSVKPRALTVGHLWMFHMFFFLSCCISIIWSLVFVLVFYLIARLTEKETLPALNSLFNLYTGIICFAAVLLVLALRYVLEGENFTFSSFVPVISDISSWPVTFISLILLFVPSVFFIIPAIPFLQALQKNSEFKIMTVWTFISWVLGTFTENSYGSFIASFPLSVMLGCVVANLALDIKRYIKSTIGVILMLSLIIAATLMALYFNTERITLFVRYMCAVSAFLVLYSLFSGGYNLLKGRYQKAFSIFAVCYGIADLVLYLSI